ncbi:MAG: hypothetical protein M3137_02040, partial [Actinomycetota bacterium]|nr:hypothetical protein [Actinomycetota bacterium]
MSEQGRSVALRGRSMSRTTGVIAMIAIGAWPLVAVGRLVGQRNAVTSPLGDQALLEMGARRAMHLQELVGPYSRFGWHHPGPALFYVLALPTWLFGSGPGISVGTALINGAAAVATVAYVWRRWGGVPALWASAALSGLCLGLSFFDLLYPWNPDVLALPIVAFTVLWADAVRGHVTALVWAAVLGSFVVQAHISTAPFVLVMIVAAVLSALV